ncbi:MAG TPA: endo-1,4-beta-xylanase [Anaerolineae bacterium]|nr:endo-1,4-beta-xylanase [Anaerolineae bacterium]
MKDTRDSFWDRVPLPVLIGLLATAILIGAVLVFAAFFNPRPPATAQSTPTPVGGLGAGIAPTAAPPDSAQPTAPPAPTATTAPGIAPAPQPTTPPLQDAAMEFGIQSNALTGDPAYTMNLVKDFLLLGWVKQQVRWGDFSLAQGQMDWSGFDRVIDAANAKGVRVLFSIVTAPEWTRPSVGGKEGPPDDLNAYAQFVGEVVDRYKGKVHAIEVWNEQNIDSEWKTNPQVVSPERYVELLQLAHQAIKSRDPNIIVISGALAPTGFFNGGCDARGCDDLPYLRRMTDLGFLQYADCIGVHVNGFNLPPEYRHDAGYNDASASFRGPFDNPHPSWSFRSTLEEYRRATSNQTPLCVTEFGWASYEGLSATALPSYEYALDNTAQEQADWNVQAFRLMREWGYVKLAFLFNLDFAQKSPQGAQDRTAPWSVTDLQGAERPSLRAVRRFMKEILGIP